ncbi:MAG: hypothetical protein C7N36_09050 [Bacteroidetes bacterium]|nr:MAG: hypothetical protein C7N36_09050 [Bacteroidota bacterium]
MFGTHGQPGAKSVVGWECFYRARINDHTAGITTGGQPLHFFKLYFIESFVGVVVIQEINQRVDFIGQASFHMDKTVEHEIDKFISGHLATPANSGVTVPQGFDRGPLVQIAGINQAG